MVDQEETDKEEAHLEDQEIPDLWEAETEILAKVAEDAEIETEQEDPVEGETLQEEATEETLGGAGDSKVATNRAEVYLVTEACLEVSLPEEGVCLVAMVLLSFYNYSSSNEM